VAFLESAVLDGMAWKGGGGLTLERYGLGLKHAILEAARSRMVFAGALDGGVVA
jgi:hypothetical protein